jgi:hypothetical protein
MKNKILYRTINYYCTITILFDILTFLFVISILFSNLEKYLFVRYYLICYIIFVLLFFVFKIINHIYKLKIIIFKYLLIILQILFTSFGYFICYSSNINHLPYFLFVLILNSTIIIIFLIVYIYLRKKENNQYLNNLNPNDLNPNNLNSNTPNTKISNKNFLSVSYKINDSYNESTASLYDIDNILIDEK